MQNSRTIKISEVNNRLSKQWANRKSYYTPSHYERY